MAENSNTASGTVDPRPRPRYGEYAPEGWSWTPPQSETEDVVDGKNGPTDSNRGENSRRNTPKASTQPPSATSLNSTVAARPVRDWDRGLTLGLVVFGLLCTFIMIAVQQRLPDSLAMLHAQNGLSAYAMDPAIPTITLVASIAQGVLWVVSTAFALWLLSRRRLAFWVPLVALLASLSVLLIAISLALMTDPALVSHFGG